MSDITENTRVAIKVGSIAAIVVLLLTVGSWWGGLQNERAQKIKTDDRQDLAISQLQETVSTINTNLALIKQSQDATMPQLIRQSTYATEVLRNIEVALASEGIKTKQHGP